MLSLDHFSSSRYICYLGQACFYIYYKNVLVSSWRSEIVISCALQVINRLLAEVLRKTLIIIKIDQNRLFHDYRRRNNKKIIIWLRARNKAFFRSDVLSLMYIFLRNLTSGSIVTSGLEKKSCKKHMSLCLRVLGAPPSLLWTPSLPHCFVGATFSY